jgi:hypothetical protein
LFLRLFFFYQEVDWNERVPGSYGRSGKAKDPTGCAEEVQISPRGKRGPSSGNQYDTTYLSMINPII